jgi:flagellar hook-associated protein 2
VKGAVDALNALLGKIKTHTNAGTLSTTGELEEGSSAGVLWGDGGARRLRDQLVNGMWYSPASGTYTSISQLGIEIGEDGLYTLDEDALQDALTTDHDAVVDFFATDTASGTPGLFGTLQSVVDAARSKDGLIDSSTAANQRLSDDIDDRILNFEVRLDAIELRYRRQFAALETLMGQMKNQQSWLASQIAQLPSQSG